MVERVEVISHRGRRRDGTNTDNTLSAVEDILALGDVGLEVDVHLTRDGAVVVHHDHYLDPAVTRHAATKKPGVVSTPLERLTLEDIRTFEIVARVDSDRQPSEWVPVPLLSEVFERWRHAALDCRLFVEMKTSPEYEATRTDARPLAEAVVRWVERYDLVPQVCLMQFDWRGLQHAKALNTSIGRYHLQFPQAPLAIALAPRVAEMLGRMRRDKSIWCGEYDPDRLGCSVPGAIALAGGTGWAAHPADIDANAAQECLARSIAILAWGLNDARDVARLQSLGASALITDDPDGCRHSLRELR